MRRVITLFVALDLLAVSFLAWIIPSHVGAAPATQGAGAVITSPQSLTAVRGNVVIEGTAAHPQFWKYEIHYGIEPNPSDWVMIGQVYENAVVNGRLETWNTELVPDGTYSLRLRVARRDGNYDEYYVRQIRVANTQPTETPTVSETATPTITPTPLPATPTIVIEQPKRETATATPSSAGGATPVPTTDAQATPSPTATPQITADLFVNPLVTGGKVVLLAFLVLGALALLRKILVTMARWVARKIRRKKDDEFDD
jgi:hypothetical protein